MKRLLIIAGWVGLLSTPGSTEAGTLFTNAVIYVRPPAVDFGPVPLKATATNTFVVENMGSSRLVGTATVAAPFKILSGGDYSLRENEAQVVTVTYTPSGTSSNMQTIYFSGGGGAKATVTGGPAPVPWYERKRE